MSSFFKQKKRAVITNNPATFEATEEDDKAFTATPKTEKEKALLINALKDHYVFSALSTTDILQVIHRMKKHERPSGDVVIQEGDEQGRKRVIQRRFNVSVPRARVSETAPTLRERSER